DASLTTRSSPSSRCTSSTGFPGSYGTSSRSAELKNASGSGRLGPRVVATAALAPEEERARDRSGRRRDARDDPAGLRARDGRLRLRLRGPLADLDREPTHDRIPPVHDAHGPAPFVRVEASASRTTAKRR